MSPSYSNRAILVMAMAAVSLSAPAALAAEQTGRTEIKPRWNRFSEQDDIEIGKKAAAEAEQKLKLINDPTVLAYVREIGGKLVAKAHGPQFPYTFKVVDDSSLNAFALPGGPVYLNRGILETARNDGEVAGVLAHEVSHAVLRHGTANMSKGSVAQTGLGVLGGLLGTLGPTKAYAGLITQAGGYGLNMVFLKYSRDAETEADVNGAQILARSGFNPEDMVAFFETLDKVTKADHSKTANWFSDHPTPDRRIERIEQEAAFLKMKPMRTEMTTGLAPVQVALGKTPAPTASSGAGSAKALAGGNTPSSGGAAGSAAAGSAAGGRAGAGQGAAGQAAASQSPGAMPAPVKASAPMKVTVDPPAKDMQVYTSTAGAYRVTYPANWKVHESKTAATIAPAAGTPDVAGHPEVVYGAIVNVYTNFGNDEAKKEKDEEGDDQTASEQLDEAFGDLRAQVLAASPHLTKVKGSGHAFRAEDRGRRGFVFTGTNPRTGIAEQVTIVARQLKDKRIVYFLFVTPQADAAAYDPTLKVMMESLKGPGQKG